jgi:prepilin-type N-terminal cleavage/methylation domain-containing protein
MRIPPRSRLTADRRAYSLIELLAVMAILSALAGLTVGSLSPVKANALTAGGNQIADLLTSARQNSLSRHAFTAVVIKSTGSARYSAVCLFELTRNDDGEFSDWKMISPWRTLPEGIRFQKDDSDFLLAANCVTSAQGKDLPTSVNFRGTFVDLTSKPDFRVQIFEPSGALIGGKVLRLRLVEGAEDTGPVIMLYTGQMNGTEPANYYDIVVVRETGQVKVERF